MTILGIDHVQITVPRDRETEVRHFYETVLELPAVTGPRTIPAAVLCFALDEATQLHVVLEDNPFRPPLNDHFAVAVEDVDAVKRRLTDHNVGYTGREHIFVQDPFGNRIEILKAAGVSPAASGRGAPR